MQRLPDSKSIVVTFSWYSCTRSNESYGYAQGFGLLLFEITLKLPVMCRLVPTPDYNISHLPAVASKLSGPVVLFLVNRRLQGLSKLHRTNNVIDLVKTVIKIFFALGNGSELIALKSLSVKEYLAPLCNQKLFTAVSMASSVSEHELNCTISYHLLRLLNNSHSVYSNYWYHS